MPHRFWPKLVWNIVQWTNAIVTQVLKKKTTNEIWVTSIAFDDAVHEVLFFLCYLELSFHFSLLYFIFCWDVRASLSLKSVYEENHLTLLGTGNCYSGVKPWGRYSLFSQLAFMCGLVRYNYVWNVVSNLLLSIINNVSKWWSEHG